MIDKNIVAIGREEYERLIYELEETKVFSRYVQNFIIGNTNLSSNDDLRVSYGSGDKLLESIRLGFPEIYDNIYERVKERVEVEENENNK